MIFHLNRQSKNESLHTMLLNSTILVKQQS
uniref:Uncharacterized protein n=1 Tax=Rhizophora mucronata TaxID=61149 RepID=A0A2P2NJS4_RHIMU